MAKLIVKRNFLLVILLALTFCQAKTTYTYAPNLYDYVLNKYDINISELENNYLLIIPVNSCSPCVSMSVEALINNQETDLMIGLILADREKDLLKFKELKESKLKNVYYDLGSVYSEYELGIFNPVLVKINKGEVILFEKLDVQNIDNVMLTNGLKPSNY